MVDLNSSCKISAGNSDFELIVTNNRTVSTISSPGYSLLNKQARTNFGVKNGRYMFEIKILRFLETSPFIGFNSQAKNTLVNQCLQQAGSTSLVRVGWATSFARLSSSLGVDHESSCYENTGTRFYTGNFKKYGDTFGPGDVIRCCIDVEGFNTKSFSYFKNGVFQGIAYRISSRQNDKAYFPAVNLRNAEVQFNFNPDTEFCPIVVSIPNNSVLSGSTSSTASTTAGGSTVASSETKTGSVTENAKGVLTGSSQSAPSQSALMNVPNAQNLVSREEIRVKDYSFIDNAPSALREYALSEQQQSSGSPPEAIFMVGLPACGKTTFAQAYAKRNPGTIIIGTSTIFDHLAEQHAIPNIATNMTTILDICGHIAQHSLKLLAGLSDPRNLIIDQCNVMLIPRLQKLRVFKNAPHVKRAFVMIISHAEQKKRLNKKSLGSQPGSNSNNSDLQNLYKNNTQNSVGVGAGAGGQSNQSTSSSSSSSKLQPSMKIGADAFRTMQANFVLPSSVEGFATIDYLEIDEVTAKQMITMNHLVAKAETHPLLRKYDFSKVLAAKSKQSQVDRQTVSSQKPLSSEQKDQQKKKQPPVSSTQSQQQSTTQQVPLPNQTTDSTVGSISQQQQTQSHISDSTSRKAEDNNQVIRDSNIITEEEYQKRAEEGGVGDDADPNDLMIDEQQQQQDNQDEQEYQGQDEYLVDEQQGEDQDGYQQEFVEEADGQFSEDFEEEQQQLDRDENEQQEQDQSGDDQQQREDSLYGDEQGNFDQQDGQNDQNYEQDQHVGENYYQDGQQQENYEEVGQPEAVAEEE